MNAGQLPLITIDVTAGKPAAVTKTLEVVLAQTQVTLRSLQQQAQVPEDQMMTPFLVSPPECPRRRTRLVYLRQLRDSLPA